ncbi:armadillo-type protein, partial [Chlamydoabsidia padenii]
MDPDESVERVEHLVRAIPLMSKTIVDDTLYEKVLTILIGFLDSDPTHTQYLVDWQGLAILQQACQQPDQDYRVFSLCMRLLGKWISKSGDNDLFVQLEQHHNSLLTLMVSGLRTSEPALRFACLEACQGLIQIPLGINWLLQNDKVKSFIALSLMDESIYVVTQGCRFYLALMEQEKQSIQCEQLCQHMDPSVPIKHFLEQQDHSALLMAALEFCWTFANSTCPSVYHYLARTHLLTALPHLVQLKTSNRLVRKRVIEILCTLFRHSPSPIQLLTNSDDGGLEETYAFIKEIYTNMIILRPANMDDVCTGVEILQVSLELLVRQQPVTPFITNQVIACKDILMLLFSTCVTNSNQAEKVAEFMQKSNRPVFLQRKLLQVIIRTLHSLLAMFPSELKIGDLLEVGLQVLSTPSFNSDQRLLKVCLQLIITSLHCQSKMMSSMELQPVFYKFMTLLIDLMDNDGLDSQNLILVLSTLDELLAHRSFESYLLHDQKLKRLLMAAIRIKFADVEWDVRDAMIEFVCGLFTSKDGNKMNFAISLDLPLLVLDRIKDQEPYVRASALKTVQMMMKTGSGWLFIQQHERLRNLSRTLPHLLYDTEAFVRRATLDAMSCLVAHRSCEGLLLTGPDTIDQKECLSSDTLAMLMNDDDIEVRIRLCQLLDHLWQLKLHEKEQNKRHTSSNPLPSYFYTLQGDHWLLESVKDGQRMVRLEAIKVIERILATTATTTLEVDKKRPFMEDEEDVVFMKQLTELDLQHLKRTIDPEDLYQEAFEISPTMMTQRTDPTDDAHLLDCY